MSKSILVIDTPETCRECPARDVVFSQWCAGNEYRHLDNYPTKPDWCPLKPVPEYELVWYDDEKSDWERGYNACLDEILGREE